MRRAPAWAGLVALAAAIAACGFVRWPLSPTWVGDSLNASLGDSPGLVWSVPQAASFRALPWPSLQVVDARLNASGVNLVSSPEAGFDLSLGGLLRGRLLAARAVLVRPVATLDLESPPFVTRDRSGRNFSPPRALSALSGVSIRNGVLRVVDGKRDLDTVLEDVQGRLDGLALGAQLSVNLTAMWRDAPVKVSGLLADPEAAARGEPSPLAFALVSPVVNLAFSGDVAGGDPSSMAGDLSASTPSLARLTRLFGAEPPAFLVADDVAVKANIKASLSDVALGEASVTSAGQTLQGALQIAHIGGRPLVSGTLDAQRLAIVPLFGSRQLFMEPNGEWSLKSFAFAPPRNVDLDLRLSAGSLDVYGRELTEAAGSVILKDGVLTVGLIDAAAYGGRIKGEARVGCAESDLDIRLSGKLADMDFGATFSDLDWPVLTGLGTAEFALATSGRSPREAVRRLSGSASLKLEHGAITGVNLEEALRRSQRRTIDVARDMRTGGTAFDQLSLEFALSDGIARVVGGELTAQGVEADLQGAADLPGRSWNLRVDAMQTDSSGGESQDAAHLSLDIDGPWSSPAIRPPSSAPGSQSVDDPSTP
jgi:AsmA protein